MVSQGSSHRDGQLKGLRVNPFPDMGERVLVAEYEQLGRGGRFEQLGLQRSATRRGFPVNVARVVAHSVLAHRAYAQRVGGELLGGLEFSERLAGGYAQALYRHVARVHDQGLRGFDRLGAAEQTEHVARAHVNRPEFVLPSRPALYFVVPGDPLVPA